MPSLFVSLVLLPLLLLLLLLLVLLVLLLEHLVAIGLCDRPTFGGKVVEV